MRQLGSREGAGQGAPRLAGQAATLRSRWMKSKSTSTSLGRKTASITSSIARISTEETLDSPFFWFCVRFLEEDAKHATLSMLCLTWLVRAARAELDSSSLLWLHLTHLCEIAQSLPGPAQQHGSLPGRDISRLGSFALCFHVAPRAQRAHVTSPQARGSANCARTRAV